MSLQAEIIPFTLRVGTGTQTVNHIQHTSIAGKAFVFMCADNTGTNSEIYSVGLSDGTTNIGNGIGIADSFGIVTARGYSTIYCLITEQAQAFFGGAQRRMSGYVSAVNVGSFDVTLDLNNTPGANWFAVMIGGDDIDCAVGLYDVTAGSGTVNVGFDVGALITLGVPDAGIDGETSGADQAFGFATQCPNVSDQFGMGVVCGWNPLGASYQIADLIQTDITSGAGGPSDSVTIASWVANGFTLTMSGSPGWNIGYLAIGGTAVSANLVQIIQPTSTGLQNTTIESTDPALVFFASTCKVASATPSVNSNIMLGCYDGTSTVSQWWGHVNNTTSRDRLSSTTNAITLATSTGASTSTVNASATCALASTNIALTWTAADATQREVWALVLSRNLTGSFSACGVNPQASITVIKDATPIHGGATIFPFSATGGLSPTTFTLTDGASQLFSGLSAGTYGIIESPPDGWTVSYSVSDGSPNTAIVLSTGEAVTVTVTNTFESTDAVFRRLRRFALPYDENVEMFLSRLEIVAAMGVGNAADPAPVIQFRLSRDGGNTWGSFQSMTIGAAANYTKRAYLTRLGRGRNLVGELICDDAVFVAWVQCVVQATRGTS